MRRLLGPRGGAAPRALSARPQQHGFV